MATATQAGEQRLLEAARVSPRVFINEYCWLRPADGGPPERFRLWPFQADVLADLERQRRLIVLKARQLGLSWLTLAYALWLASCNRGQTVLIFNRGQREAKELLRRVRFMWQRLPDELRPELGVSSTEELEFPALDSRIASLPSSEDSGSGYTATLVVMDEWAKIPRAAQLFTTVLPTLSGDRTRLVGISTAKGYHNHFARTWKRAVDGANAYFPVFIPSSAHPGRDEAWHDRARREFDTERDFLQEYPEDPRDAFQLPGDAVFADFERGRHTTTATRSQDSPWPVWRGIDFGFHYSPVYWAEVQAERVLFIFDELDAQHLTTEDLAVEIQRRDAEHGLTTASVPAGVDPAGKARTSQAGTQSDHLTLQRAGIHVRYIEPSVPKDRVGLIQRLLREDRLIINAERCPFLVEALEQAEWATRPVQGSQGVERYPKETYREDGYYEHPLDSAGYLAVNVFPPHGKPVGARSQPSGGQVRDRYSDSEFG